VKLANLVRGELDWIVMKTLEKDRNRRYETPSAVAADVQRYLKDETVQACPPSARYRLRKFGRRNKSAIATVAVVSLALVLGTVVSISQAIRATKAETQSKANEVRALGEEQKARTNLKLAREAVDQMLLRVAGRLANVPHMEQVRRELLGDALKFYEALLQDHGNDPVVRFEKGLVFYQFGKMQMLLGEDRAAEQACSEAILTFQKLADETPHNADYRFNLAQAFNELGKVMEQMDRSSDAEDSYRQALAITRKLDADYPGRYRGWLAGRLNNIGIVLCDRGKLAEAESMHRESMAIRAENPHKLFLSVESLINLGVVLSQQTSRLFEAEKTLRQGLEIQSKVVGSSPSDCEQQSRFATAHFILAGVLANTSRLPEAERSYRKALAIQAKLAMDFPNTPKYRLNLASTQFYLSVIFKNSGQLAEAENALRECLAALKKLAADFPNEPKYRDCGADAHHNLGEYLLESDRSSEAASAYRHAQEIYEELSNEFPGNSEYRYKAADNIGSMGLAILDAEQLEEAERLVQRNLASSERLTADSPNVARYKKSLALAHGRLGMVRYRASDGKTAVTSIKKCFELGGDEEDATDCKFFLAMSHWKLGDKNAAQQAYDQAAQWMDKHHPKDLRLHRFRAEAAGLLKGKSGDTIPK